MVQAVLHASQALLDGLVGDLELLRGDAAVVVFQADAVVAPEPVEGSGGGREGAGGV
jgi:hypothetical protein